MARGHEHGAILSSCLAGPVVAFGRQAAWWPGAHWLWDAVVSLASELRGWSFCRDCLSTASSLGNLDIFIGMVRFGVDVMLLVPVKVFLSVLWLCGGILVCGELLRKVQGLAYREGCLVCMSIVLVQLMAVCHRVQVAT